MSLGNSEVKSICRPVVGCTNPYSGRAYINKEIIPVQSGSYLFSHEDYRKENVGGELFLKIANLHPTRNCYFRHFSNGYRIVSCPEVYPF